MPLVRFRRNFSVFIELTFRINDILFYEALNETDICYKSVDIQYT